jgi:NADPH:quinone reductase-like Zn-dependent oxidoreductase
LQIAAALGATVIATSSSDAKLELARSIGATHTINYVKTPNWDEEVLRLTSGVGVDQVIENGGPTTLLRSIKSTRMGGLISCVGFLGGMESLPVETYITIIFRAVISEFPWEHEKGSRYMYWQVAVKGCAGFSRDSIVELVELFKEHGIEPVVAKTFRFDEAVEALEALKGQKEVGKICIQIAEEWGDPLLFSVMG